LELLDHPQDVDGVWVDRRKLEEKLGWLRDFRGELGTWQDLEGVISTTLEYIRYEGYHRQAACELARRLKPFLSETLTRRIAAKILAFVKEQSVSAVPGERLIGSSEVLESLIGTGTRMERQQSKSELLLAMAAVIAKPTAEYIKQAMADIKTEEVYEGAHGLLGRSVQSQRRLAFAQADSGTETR
jgi:hypothetical protein